MTVSSCQTFAPRMITTGGLLAVLGLLSACASMPVSGSSDVYTGPLVAQSNYDWIVNLEEEEPVLAYGVANSDDAPVIMDCQRRSAKVRVSVAADNARQNSMLFATDKVSRRFSAENAEDGLTGTYRMETHIDASDPLFAAMEQAGWVAVRVNNEWQAMVAHEGTKLTATRFSNACR